MPWADGDCKFRDESLYVASSLCSFQAMGIGDELGSGRARSHHHGRRQQQRPGGPRTTARPGQGAEGRGSRERIGGDRWIASSRPGIHRT